MIALRILAAFAALVGPSKLPAAALSTLLPNTVSVEAAPHEQVQPEPVFAAALDDALASRGFTALQEPGHARLIAALAVTRTEVGTTHSTVPVNGPTAMAGGTARVGAAFNVNLPTTKQRIVPLVRTRVDLRLIARADEKVMWQGSAVTVRAADTDARLIASTLANGVLSASGDAADGIIAVP